MVTGHVELANAILCFFSRYEVIWERRALRSVMYCRTHLPIVLDLFRRFLTSSHCDVDKRSFSKSGKGWSRIFLTFSITSTGNRILFSLNGI